MNIFLKRIAGFGLFFCSLVLVLTIGFVKSSSIDGDSITPYTTVILGDSHTECAISDSILKESINLSKSADTYFHSFVKLKYLTSLPENRIRRVILGVSPHSFSTALQQWYEDPRYVAPKVSNYLSLFEAEDIWFALKSNPAAFLDGMLQFDKYQGLRILERRERSLRDLGGFLALNKTFDPTKNDMIAGSVVDDADREERQLFYLNQIEALCKKYELELVMLSTPLHQTYPGNRSGEFFAKLDSISFSIKDYTNLKLDSDAYADTEHLNARGASLFTHLLAEELNR